MAIRFLSFSALLLLAGIGAAYAQAVGVCPGSVPPSFAGCLPAIVAPLQPTDGVNVLQSGRPNAIWGTAGINQLLATPTPMNPTTLTAGTLTVTGTTSLIGNASAGGTFAVTGNLSTMAGLTVTGPSTLTGNISTGGTLTVAGATTLNGSLGVAALPTTCSGQATGQTVNIGGILDVCP